MKALFSDKYKKTESYRRELHRYSVIANLKDSQKQMIDEIILDIAKSAIKDYVSSTIQLSDLKAFQE